MTNTNQLDADLKAIVAAFFAANVRGLLERPERLEALAHIAGVAPERVPAIHAALASAERASLSS